METHDEFLPDWASAPGETIGQILEERGMTISQLASVIGTDLDYARLMMIGERVITDEIAESLATIGGTKEFWIARERNYRDELIRLGMSK